MSDFGALLKQAREHRGISLRQIATSTKISMTALEALERDDFSRLPGGIFSRAFVRAYAIEVGLDPEATVATFLEKYGMQAANAEVPEPAPVSADDRAFIERQQQAAQIARIGVIVAAVVVLGLIAWWASNRVTRHTSTASRSDSAVESPADASASADTPAKTEATPASGPAAAKPAGNAETFGIDIESTNDDCGLRVTADGKVVFPGQVITAGERFQRRCASRG